MIEERKQMLITTIKKLYHRDAKHNIQRIFQKTHEADIAAILEGFESAARYELFKLELSPEKQSAILSHLNPEQQQEILACISKQEAVKLVDHMASDDVADMLGHLPDEDSQQILASMDKKESDEVSDLMGYPEDSAGGIMSSNYLALNQELIVSDAIREIQREDKDGAITFYIYVINDNKQLVGVVSLKQLLLSKQTEKLKSLMTTDVISVTDDTPQDRVARVVEHYDFLSLPVVDVSNCLVGVVTVDDIIDVIREEAEEDLMALGQVGHDIEASILERLKSRLNWLVLAFVGGLFCFSLIYFLGHVRHQMEGVLNFWYIAAYIPMLLSIGSTVGSQSATLSVGALRSGAIESQKLKQHLLKEFKLGLIFSVAFSVLIYLLANFLLKEPTLATIFAMALATQIFVSMVLGNLVPLFTVKIGLDPSVVSIPIYATFADVSAIAVLFFLLIQFSVL